MQRAVSIKNLTKRFGKFVAVDDISIEVESGEIFGFLGANGAGKTTTIRMLCGLLLPNSGKGTVNGFDLYKENERIKESIGYMSQKFSLYGDLTGLENLSFYGSIYKISHQNLKRRIDELVELLELSAFIERQTKSLPTGWRQRLALAASVLHRPRVLFLDEPTAGVDPVFRRRFWEILYRMADDGTTLFITTHYMDEAEFCRRITVMHRGRIIEAGEPQRLISRYGASNLQELFIRLISERDVA